MNCDEYQRLAPIDPYRLPASAKAHAGSCQNCAAHLARTVQIDEDLINTIRKRTADGLKAKLLLNSRLRPVSRVRGWAALAASLLLISSFVYGYRSYVEPTTPDGWADVMIRHIEDNPQEMVVGDADPHADQNRLISAVVGIDIESDSGLKLLRSDRCVMKRTGAVHSVIDVDGTRAVLFFVPKMLGVGNYSEKGWSTALRAYDGRTVAVVAHDEAALRKVLDALDSDLNGKRLVDLSVLENRDDA